MEGGKDWNFNPLHREGGDVPGSNVRTRHKYFNPLHREGGDHGTPIIVPYSNQFQSTPPRGWRQRPHLYLKQIMNFNPLHREGGDLQYLTSVMRGEVFQSTPPRGWRLTGPLYQNPMHNISIHSTARVETAILHNNHYYSSSHFHKQIISHPPQITANHPCTLANPFSLCKFSGANPPVNPCLLQVRTKILYTALPPAARSEYQRFFHINPLIHPNMVHFCSVFIPKVVKPKAVRLFINYICQYRL